MSLQDRVLFITGATRGIGRAIALRLAREGVHICLASKTAQPHPRLPGTLASVAAEIEALGVKALPIQLDVRDAVGVDAALAACAEHFGGVDLVVNNASAIQLTNAQSTPMKRFDLMHQVNVRGTYCVTRAALPWLLKSDHAHVLTLSPPLNLDPKWFANHTAYTMSKYGMSMVTLGLAAELSGRVAVNSLWPRTTIATAAVEMLGGEALMRCSRKPAIMADAAAVILAAPPEQRSGQFLIDDEVLRSAGIDDLSGYAVDPSAELAPDLFI